MDTYRKLTREHAELEPVVELYRRYRQAEADLKTATEMVADPAMREFAETEVADRTRIAHSKPNCRNCCCRATPTTSAIFSSRCAPAPAATKSALFAGTVPHVRALRRTQALAGRNHFGKSRRTSAVTAKSSPASSARARIPNSSSNPAAIACSACRSPKPRAASTPRPAPSR